MTRIHMEEDAGKLLHDTGTGTAVDYNRGCAAYRDRDRTGPRSAEEARVFLETLKCILKYTGVSDCKMQEGSLRSMSTSPCAKRAAMFSAPEPR